MAKNNDDENEKTREAARLAKQAWDDEQIIERTAREIGRQRREDEGK